jgi:hypothetical protein
MLIIRMVSSHLKWFIEEILSSNDHAPNNGHRIPQHIQAKDESVKLKEGLVAIVFGEEFSQAFASLGDVFKVEQAEPGVKEEEGGGGGGGGGEAVKREEEDRE